MTIISAEQIDVLLEALHTYIDSMPMRHPDYNNASHLVTIFERLDQGAALTPPKGEDQK